MIDYFAQIDVWLLLRLNAGAANQLHHDINVRIADHFKRIIDDFGTTLHHAVSARQVLVRHHRDGNRPARAARDFLTITAPSRRYK